MLGLSTYAFVWRSHPDRARPLRVEDMLESAAGLGCGVLQLCDHPRAEAPGAEDLTALYRRAESMGIVFETGTRGVEPDHLRAHLRTAEALGARLVRSMLSSVRGAPTMAGAVAQLREVMPMYEAAGVTLALETYEQFSACQLVDVVETVGSPNLGICLDPGNSVARLEHPMDVARTCAPYVVNHHVKDFDFSRLEATVGFQFAGAPLGEGLLDHDAVVAVLRTAGRTEVNQIVEHWLTRKGSIEETAAEEERWVAGAVAYLREREPAGEPDGRPPSRRSASPAGATRRQLERRA